jgi:hypothetical protein
MKIRIQTKSISIEGMLDDTPTAKRVLAALPYSSEVNTWGDEIYFSLPIADSTIEHGATDVVDPGTICYWVQGSSLAIPFGPTPVSLADECRLVTAVNPIGRIIGDPHELSKLQSGDTVTVSCDDGR